MQTDLSHFESLYPEDTRFEEVDKILNFVKSGRSCQVVGVPGSGKGTLLGLLSYNKQVREKHLGENQKWFHFVYMDFSEVKKRSLYDVVKFILISITYSLSERKLKQESDMVNKFLKEAIGFSDELILFQALKKAIDYLAIEKEMTVVFLFDRFDQYLPDVNENFFSNLKILRNRAKYRFSSVFALKRPMEDMIEPYVFSEFHEFLAENVVYFRLYDCVGMDFRFSYLEKVTGKKMGEEVKKEVVKITGGHGQLARLSYEIVLSEKLKEKELKKYLFSKNVVKRALDEIWNFLTPFEQVYLKNLTVDKRVGEENLYLKNIGVVKENKIAIPLLEEFVKHTELDQADKITYKTETNEIFKGQEAITDNLSPSEFRLLRFLIQNSNRVCEKEEIISNVWKDTKTQEGVTDQALDQIIYRLRKKIEEDPNCPAHLQTVKGRGVKFVA